MNRSSRTHLFVVLFDGRKHSLWTTKLIPTRNPQVALEEATLFPTAQWLGTKGPGLLSGKHSTSKQRVLEGKHGFKLFQTLDQTYLTPQTLRGFPAFPLVGFK